MDGWADEWMDLQTNRWMVGHTVVWTLNRLDGREYRIYEYVVLLDLQSAPN
jgi:hypothetical protein